MITLVSGATRFPRSATVGHLIVPAAWAPPESLGLERCPWAMDNGGFKGVDVAAFVRMLKRFYRYPGCLFVTVPDVVKDAAATLEEWPFWAPIIRSLGHRPAFVAQNGLTAGRVPWSEMGALFVGGDDEYKEGADARTLCAMAKARGLWVHWGRVNGARRYELALKAGADSIDGTGFSRHANINIPKVAEWHDAIAAQPELGL